MNESISTPLSGRKAAFGSISLVCVSVASRLLLYLFMKFDEIVWLAAMNAAWGGGATGEVNSYDVVGIGAEVLWVLGLGFAVTGLVRAERPRWPSIVGLVLCLVPSAIILSSLVTAHQQAN